jgi:hypothetical protein
MADLISWLMWAAVACGPLALVLYWRDRHARAEHRQLLAAAIAQRDGALARASDAEDAVVNGTRRIDVGKVTAPVGDAFVCTVCSSLIPWADRYSHTHAEPYTAPLPATHPQRRRRK